MLGVVAAVFLVPAAILAINAAQHQAPPPDRSRVLPIDAWAPYWALDASNADLSLRAPLLREISPFWFSVTGPTEIVANKNAPAKSTKTFLSAARRAGVPLVPSIFDDLPAGQMASVLADPATRTAHVDALMKFAADGKFAGLDIDYEKFAFSDDKATWVATRPNWVAFVTELSTRLHTVGRTLTVSVPPVYDSGQTTDSGYWVYDYAAITPLVDRVRVMAYDFSTSEAGPIAPLEWVHRLIDGVTKTAGDPTKLVLGVPLYGYNWPTSTTGDCSAGKKSERTTVRLRDLPDLLVRRPSTPTFDQVSGEWTFSYQLPVPDAGATCIETRTVWYVDGAGAQVRTDLARDAGWAGVSLWALGYDDQRVWDTFAAAHPTTTSTAPATSGG